MRIIKSLFSLVMIPVVFISFVAETLPYACRPSPDFSHAPPPIARFNQEALAAPFLTGHNYIRNFYTRAMTAPTLPDMVVCQRGHYIWQWFGEAMTSISMRSWGGGKQSAWNAYFAIQEPLSLEMSDQLTDIALIDRQNLISNFKGVAGKGLKIEIVRNQSMRDDLKPFVDQNGYVPLVSVNGNTLQLKESLFTAPSNAQVQALLLGWSLAVHWLMNHPDAFVTRLLLFAAVQFGITDQGQQLDLAARALNLWPWFYWRMRMQTQQLIEPPRTLEQILDTASDKSDTAQSLITRSYELAGNTYRQFDPRKRRFIDALRPSGKSIFAGATDSALRIAQLGGDAELISAALLADLPPHELKKLPENLQEMADSARRIVNLIHGTRRLLAEPIHSEVTRRRADYTVQYMTNRLIMLAGLEAQHALAEPHEPIMTGDLLAFYLVIQCEKIASVGLTRKEEINDLYREMQMIHAPLAERLGLLSLAAQIRDEAFRVHDPQAYEETREKFRDTLGLEQTQAEAELDYFKGRIGEVLQKVHHIEPIVIRSRVKTIESAHEKRQEERHQQRVRKEAPTADISSQYDLLGLMVVVNSPEDLEKIRHSLDYELGTPVKPTLPLPDRTRAISYKGIVVYQLSNFNYEHDGRKVTVELQIMCKDQYHVYLSGRSPAKYQEAHWKKESARNVDLLTLGLSDQSAPIGQQFDHQDPLLTGDFRVDADAIFFSLGESKFPIYTLARNAESASALDGFDWHPLKLPEGSVIADLVFRPDAQGSPYQYYEPYRLRFQEVEQQPGSFTWERTPLGLGERLLPDDIIVFDRKKGSRSYAVGEQRSLLKIVQTAWAKLQLLPVTTNSDKLYRLKEKGRSSLMEQFGNINDPAFQHQVLDPICQWLGLENITRPDRPRGQYDLLYLAIALANENPSDETFRRVKEDMFTWFQQRFVQFSYPDFQKGVQDEPKSIYTFTVSIDENQVGMLADLKNAIRKAGYQLTGNFAVSAPPALDSVRLSVTPQASSSGNRDLLFRELKSVRRKRGERQPVPDARRLEIYAILSAREDALASLLNKLSQMNVDVESGESLTQSEPNQRYLQLTVLAPALVKGAHQTRPIQALHDAFMDMKDDGLVEDFDVASKPINAATVVELNSLLREQAGRIPRDYWKYLPHQLRRSLLDPRLTIRSLPDSEDPAEQVDEVLVRYFRTLLYIASVYHGFPDPQHPNSQWAAPQFRNKGAPYVTHLIGTSWRQINVGLVRDPRRIRKMLLHDLFEDGVPNVLKLFDSKTPDQAMDHILERIQLSFPQWLADALIEDIEQMTWLKNEPYEAYAQRLKEGPSSTVLLDKLFDVMDNLHDRHMRYISKTIRYYVDVPALPNIWADIERMSPADQDSAVKTLAAFLHALMESSSSSAVLEPYYDNNPSDEIGDRDKVIAANHQMSQRIDAFLDWTASEEGSISELSVREAVVGSRSPDFNDFSMKLRSLKASLNGQQADQPKPTVRKKRQSRQRLNNSA